MIRIVIDSTSSLTPDEYKKYDIDIAPLYIVEGTNSKKELVEITYAEFYQQLRNGSRFTTSQPTPDDFLRIFQPAIAAGDEVICIVLSSQISGTLNSASLAKSTLDTDRISIIDSRHSAGGEAFLAIKACELAQAGKSRAEIVSELEGMVEQTRTFFVLDTLKYLYEGGRLSGAQALIGSLIQIKPILWFDATGKITAFEKIRTMKAAKARTLDLVKEAIPYEIEFIIVQYADNLQEAIEFAKGVEELVGKAVPLRQVSPVLGSHVGPDAFAVSFVTRKKME